MVDIVVVDESDVGRRRGLSGDRHGPAGAVGHGGFCRRHFEMLMVSRSQTRRGRVWFLVVVAKKKEDEVLTSDKLKVESRSPRSLMFFLPGVC